MEVFCESYPEMCVEGAPDIVAVCDSIWQFPEEYFSGTGINDLCDVDFEDACTAFPELCDETTGTFSSDICNAFPEKCDDNSEEYSPCAADLYACIMDPEFDICGEFPEVCGIPDAIFIPIFEPSSG